MVNQERRGLVWAVEVIVVGITTLMLLPVTCLYAMDLAAGTITPDLEWALAAGLGLFGLWVTVLKGDSFFIKRQGALWGIVISLLVSIFALANLVWGSQQSSAPGLTWLILGAPIVVAVHQLVRLFKLRRTAL